MPNTTPNEERNHPRPIVNMNGTSAKELLKQALLAHDTCLKAYGAICDAMPHGRDYQCNPAADYVEARRLFTTSMNTLYDTKEVLETYCTNILAQMKDEDINFVCNSLDNFKNKEGK